MLHVAYSTWLAANLRGNSNLVDSFVKQSNVCMQVMTCTMASSCIRPKIQQQLSHSKTNTMHVVWRHSLDKIKGLQTTQPWCALNSSYLQQTGKYCAATINTKHWWVNAHLKASCTGTYHRVCFNCFSCILYAGLLCPWGSFRWLMNIWKCVHMTTFLSWYCCSWLFTVAATVLSIELDEVLNHGSCRKITGAAYNMNCHLECFSVGRVNLNTYVQSNVIIIYSTSC